MDTIHQAVGKYALHRLQIGRAGHVRSHRSDGPPISLSIDSRVGFQEKKSGQPSIINKQIIANLHFGMHLLCRADPSFANPKQLAILGSFGWILLMLCGGSLQGSGLHRRSTVCCDLAHLHPHRSHRKCQTRPSFLGLFPHALLRPLRAHLHNHIQNLPNK